MSLKIQERNGKYYLFQKTKETIKKNCKWRVFEFLIVTLQGPIYDKTLSQFLNFLNSNSMRFTNPPSVIY